MIGPGIHEVLADTYHGDPCSVPSLSASLAHILTIDSPLHAYTAHPKLNPNFQREDEDKFSVGTAAHALLLQGDEIAEVLDFPDMRTKDAKAARDEARANGRLPLLAKHWDGVRAMVEAARAQLIAHRADPPLFRDGKAEQTLVWEEDGGVVCRARLDWLRDDRQTIDDYKSTGASANPERWVRTLFGIGADVQAAFYLRGLKATSGVGDADFRWAVQETFPPYALSVVAPGPAVLEIGDAKVEYALNVWRECLSSGVWPAYPSRVCFAELPAYEEARWLEREAREAA